MYRAGEGVADRGCARGSGQLMKDAQARGSHVANREIEGRSPKRKQTLHTSELVRMILAHTYVDFNTAWTPASTQEPNSELIHFTLSDDVYLTMHMECRKYAHK